jgi:hypothetical protein
MNSYQHPPQPPIPSADDDTVTYELPTPPYLIVGTIVESLPPNLRSAETETEPILRITLAYPRWTFPRWARRKAIVVPVGSVCLLVLLIVAVFLSGVSGALFALFVPPQTAAIAISPAYSEMRAVVPILATSGPLTNPQHQVALRDLSSTSQTLSQTTRATGVQYSSPVAAHGMVIFYNEASYWLTVAAGVTLTGRDGVQVVTTTAVSVPPGNPPSSYGISGPVYATAVVGGSRGNITADDLDGLCCVAGIVVKNSAAFIGGLDPQPYSVVAPADVSGVARALSPLLTQNAQSALLAQVRANERTVADSQCTTRATASPPVGQRSRAVAVSVVVRCGGEVYDYAGALKMALTLYEQQFSSSLGKSYVLPSGQFMLAIGQPQAVVGLPGAVTFPVTIDGVWVYHFSHGQLSRLAQKIAGTDKHSAQVVLSREAGVLSAHIVLHGGDGTTLPGQPASLQITIQPAPMPQGA